MGLAHLGFGDSAEDQTVFAAFVRQKIPNVLFLLFSVFQAEDCKSATKDLTKIRNVIEIEILLIMIFLI